MGVIKTTLLLFLSVFIIITLNIVVIGTMFNSLFYPEVYIKSFEKNDMYNFISEELKKTPGNELISIPEGGIKQLADEKVTNLFSYLRGENETLDLSLKLDKSKFKEVFINELNKAPICTGFVEPIQNNQIVCRPNNITSEEFVNEHFDRNNINILNEESFDFKKELDKDNKLEMFKGVYTILKKVYFSFIIFLIILLIIIFVLNINNINKAFRWLAVPFIIASISLISSGFVIINYVKKMDFGGTDILTIKLGNILKDVFILVINKQIIYGFVILGIALLMFIISFFINKKVEVKEKKK